MRLLLDTHSMLWALLDDLRLGMRARHAIRAAKVLFISAATVWEVAIKSALGKLTVPPDLFDQALAAGAMALPITWSHVQGVQDLPPYHADTFDRLLIAQARHEGLTLVSADHAFAAYDVDLIAD